MFKVVLSEEKIRSMSEDEFNHLSANIDKLGILFENQIGRKLRNSDDVIENTAYVAATVFISQEVRNLVVDISNQGANVIFSYKEMLIDNCVIPESDQTVINKAQVQDNLKVYIYNNNINSSNINNWIDEADNSVMIKFSLSELNVLDSTEIEYGTKELQVVDQGLIQSFTDSLVDQIASSSDITSITNSNGIITYTTAGSEMIVEYEDTTITKKGWKKKIKKARAKIVPRIPIVGPVVGICKNPESLKNWLVLGTQVAVITIMIVQPQLAPGVIVDSSLATGGSSSYIWVSSAL